MNIRPLGDKLWVKQHDAEEKTASGLVLSNPKAPRKANVLACGPGTVESPMECDVGDVVYYTNFGGTELNVEGEKVLILRMTDILAVEHG